MDRATMGLAGLAQTLGMDNSPKIHLAATINKVEDMDNKVVSFEYHKIVGTVVSCLHFREELYGKNMNTRKKSQNLKR